MRRYVAVDVRMAAAAGIGTYIRHVIPRVVEAAPHLDFFLLGSNSQIARIGTARCNNTTVVECQAPIYSLTEQFEVVRRIPRETDLFWAPHYNIPLLYRGRLIVTVHDVIHLAVPEYNRRRHMRYYAQLMLGQVARRARVILADSDYTKSEFIRYCGAEAARVHTVHLGVEKAWFNAERTTSPFAVPYVLYVGSLKPHKNVVAIVKALKMVADDIPHHLVIVGKREGFIVGDTEAEAAAGELSDRVHFVGQLTDEELRRYTANAAALVLASWYEGFGLPPLEAMACGCPVLVSGVTSLPEICGDAALYCDPSSASDISAKIRQLATDARLRAELQRRGRERAMRFTWEKCAERTLQLLQRALVS